MSKQVTKQLAERSLAGFKESLRTTPSLSAVASKFTKQHAEAATKRRRVVLLDMNDEDDVKFWQVLSNTPEKFEITSEKESHQRGEYVIRIIFFEKGDDLPVTKTKDELIKENI